MIAQLLYLKDKIHSFNVVVCGNDVEVHHGKPNPDIFAVAARRLGVPAEQCLVVEDSLAGVTAARAAGMRVCAVCPQSAEASVVLHKEIAHALGHSDCVIDDLLAFDFNKWGIA